METVSYEYTGISSSATVTLPAGAELSGVNARAVKLTEEGLTLPGAGEDAIGIVLITEDETYKKGEDVTIQVKDIGVWKAGAEFSAGALLAVDAEGYCQEATAGQWIVGRALTVARAKGDIIRAQLIHAGKLA